MFCIYDIVQDEQLLLDSGLLYGLSMYTSHGKQLINYDY